MAKIDVVKAEITLFQIFIVVLFGINISLVGLVAQNDDAKKEA